MKAACIRWGTWPVTHRLRENQPVTPKKSAHNQLPPMAAITLLFPATRP